MSDSAVKKNATNADVSTDRAANLLRIMKLEPEVDFDNFRLLRKWVSEHTEKSSPGASVATQTVASLLLLRVTRAFQKRSTLPQSKTPQKRKSEDLPATPASKKKPAPSPHLVSTESLDNSATLAALAVSSINRNDVKFTRKVKVSPGVMQALMFLGSDLKNVLHSTSTPHSHSTIADVADFCLQLLDLKNPTTARIASLFRCMLLTVKKSSDEKELSIFKTFVEQTFEAIRFQAVSATELYFDFDFMWNSACSDASFHAAFNALSESYQAAWKLSRYWALRLSLEQTPPRTTSGSVVRRSQVLGTAASLVWMAALGNLMPKTLNRAPKAHVDAIEAGGVGGQGPAKRPRVDHVADGGTAPSHGGDYLDTVLNVVNKLFAFLAWASPNEQDICAISRQELERQVLLLSSDMCSLQLVRGAPPESEEPTHLLDGSAFSRALRNSVPKIRFIGYNYKAVVDTLVLTTQQLLNPTMATPTPITNVLFLAPTVIGEPWGQPKTLPKDATKLLCGHSTNRPSQADSSLVVVADNSILSRQQPATKPAQLPSVEDTPLDVNTSVENVVTPTLVITDTMELNEWTLSVLSLSIVKPSENLLALLAQLGNGRSFLRGIITPVLNRAMSRAQRGGGDARLSIGTRDGLVYITGDINDDVHFCAALVGFYYHALEAILQDNTLVNKESFLTGPHFHRALLTCCHSCMLKAVGNYPNMMKLSSEFEGFTIYTILEILECSAYTYLKVAEPFCRVLASRKTGQRPGESPIVFALPRVLQSHMNRTEIQVLDSVVWVQSVAGELGQEVLATTIEQLQSQAGAWPPEVLEPVLPEEMEDSGIDSEGNAVASKSPFASTDETNFLSYLLRRLLKVVYYRIQAMCHALSLPVDPVANQVLVAFRYLLRHAVELLYDRHVDQSLLCTIYAVCKIMKVAPSPSFARVTEAYLAVRADELGEKSCQLIVRRVKLVERGSSGTDPSQSPIGDIIMFYNYLFVPKMRQHLMGSKALKRSAYQLQMIRMASVPRVMVPPGGPHVGLPPSRKAGCQVR